MKKLAQLTTREKKCLVDVVAVFRCSALDDIPRKRDSQNHPFGLLLQQALVVALY